MCKATQTLSGWTMVVPVTENHSSHQTWWIPRGNRGSHWEVGSQEITINCPPLRCFLQPTQSLAKGRIFMGSQWLSSALANYLLPLSLSGTDQENSGLKWYSLPHQKRSRTDSSHTHSRIRWISPVSSVNKQQNNNGNLPRWGWSRKVSKMLQTVTLCVQCSKEMTW